jgi:tetratricopeptide (TPR) repeat protein/transcriptional regulator with XRE-family HTH domain
MWQETNASTTDARDLDERYTTNAFGALLRRFRTDADFSQEALAERARMSPETISALERGARRSPYRETVASLADALGLNADDRVRLETAAARPQRPCVGKVTGALGGRAARPIRDRAPQPVHAGVPPNALEPPWLVPDALRTRYFTGREHLLALLRAQLLGRHRAALCGLGGVGKTQAAIEYAVRHRAEYTGGVFWTNAETAGGLTGAFFEIAKTLGIPIDEPNDQEQAVRSVFRWMSTTDRWLLILDNVDDRHEVRPFVPQLDNGDVLITSRESVFGEMGIPRALEVTDLEDDEAARFLLTRTGRKGNESGERAAVTELAAELGNFPLALEQAAAYIAETNASFSDYLNAFRQRRVTLLEKASGLVSHDTVADTWAANFEAVERVSPAAADVLRVSAFLAPDAIPFEMFSSGAQALTGPIAEALSDADALAVSELLRPLGRYSLIRSDATARAYSVHRLVQEIVRTAIGQSERRTYVERAVAALDAAFPRVEYVTWGQCDRLVPHVEAITGWVDSYDLPSEHAGRASSRAGWYLTERGRYEEAEVLLERALAIGERTLGPDHLDVAQSLNNLALNCTFRGRHTEARRLHGRALAIRERALGPDHPDVAESLNNLASLHVDRGRYADARPLYERALAIWKRALGPSDPAVAISLNNLGCTSEHQGRYGEAESLHEEALAIRERAYGPDHPDVALSLNNLSNVYVKQGRYAEAKPGYEYALAIRERALGPGHERVADTFEGIANLHLTQGDHAEAKRLYDRALAIGERVHGPGHERVAVSLAGLARIHCARGEYAEAEPLFERALAIQERALGLDHPDIAQTLAGLASLRKAQSRTAEAVALYERALAIKEGTFAPDHLELEQLRRNINATAGNRA